VQYFSTTFVNSESSEECGKGGLVYVRDSYMGNPRETARHKVFIDFGNENYRELIEVTHPCVFVSSAL